MKKKIITSIVSSFLIYFGCTENSTAPVETLPPEQHQWISGIPFNIEYENIEHDDRILETTNFLTFSDASSDEVKILYSQMAEQSFREIKQTFGISSSEELGIVDTIRSSKITIYSDRYLQHSNMAFPFGFLLIALDSPEASLWFGDDQSALHTWYRKDVKHETMHVMQWLFGLDWNSSLPWPQRWGRTWPEFWFSEGISEYVSGGAFHPIENNSEVNEWLQNPDHINPIKIIKSTDAPIPDGRIGEYYPMFGLAVRYLLDENGLGKSFNDVKDMYLDMRSTVSFRESFQIYMGITVEDYEENFFAFIEEFFNQSPLQ